MADEQTTTLAELADKGAIIPARPPRQSTVLGIGQDPASMGFEIRDEASDGVHTMAPSDTARLAEIPLEQSIPVDDDALAAALASPDEGLDTAIDFAESADGQMLLAPIGGELYEVAKSLPQRRYQKMVKMFQGLRHVRATGKMTDMSAEDLETALSSFEEMLQLCMEPHEFERLALRFDDLRNPVGPSELNPVMTGLLKRYMRGVGAAQGKPQG